MDPLRHRTIIITGASKGIGRALALAFADRNVNLALVARSEDGLKQVQQEVIGKGSSCAIFIGSVADEVFVNGTVETVLQQFGKIDLMINNAGFGIFRSADAITSQEWDDVFATNTKGTFLFCKAVMPHMKERKQGHIINVASDVAKRVFGGGSVYCASKYAQDAFSMAIRKELRPYDIKVSVVYSGLVDSDFHTGPQGSPDHEDWLKNEDMANAILFIASQPRHVVIDELMIHPLSQEY